MKKNENQNNETIRKVILRIAIIIIIIIVLLKGCELIKGKSIKQPEVPNSEEAVSEENSDADDTDDANDLDEKDQKKDDTSSDGQSLVNNANNPSIPTNPVNTMNPSSPANPSNPSIPTNPVNTMNPSNPANPSNPSIPANPVDPKPEKKELKEEDIVISLPENLEENGETKEVTVDLLNEVTANVTVTYEGSTTDGKPVNAGEYVAVVTVTGTGNYEGTIEKRIRFILHNEGDANDPSHGNPDGEGENNQGGGDQNQDENQGSSGNNPDGENNQGTPKVVNSEPVFVPVQKAPVDSNPAPASEPVSIPTPTPAPVPAELPKSTEEVQNDAE